MSNSVTLCQAPLSITQIKNSVIEIIEDWGKNIFTLAGSYEDKIHFIFFLETIGLFYLFIFGCTKSSLLCVGFL